MNKVLVSSTPHPKRKHYRFTDLFDDDPVSPITQLDNPVRKQPVTNCISKVKSVKQATRKNTALPQNKKNEECASSAVLKELGAVGKTHRTLLSHSRNLYNMYPELIIVDSDEENTEILSPIEKPQVKKVKTVTKSNAKTGNSAEHTSVKQHTHSTPELNGKDKEQRIGASKIPEKTSPVNAVTQGPPLDCSENIHSTKAKKIVKKNRKAPVPKNCSTIVINSEGEESKLSRDSLLDNVINSRKKKCMKLSLLEDWSEEEVITFTPRRIKNNKNKVDTAVNVEESYSNVGKVENNIENMSEIVNKNQQCDKKLPPRRCKKITEIAHVDKHLEKPKNESNSVENSFPKGCVSHFKDIVFKHSVYTGGVTANCLRTENLNFGYIEVTGVFEGKRSNITFTVLEGEVLATWMGASHRLSPGDILHINTESGYKFQNVGENSYARLLYVKENHS
uniref:Uncharacterized protein n=1 Tax=Cuerna arida TaxID=1464854 RepID=A0A1B6EKU3_9HEMI